MAETTDGEEAQAGPARPLSNWIPLGVATAVIALLVTGWPLVNALLPGTEPVRSGQTLRVGSAGGYEASLTFDRAGWALHPAMSTANQSYTFSRGPVELKLNSVIPLGTTEPGPEELWSGMRRIARVEEPSARLGDPAPIEADDGTEGLTGTLRSDSEQGVAALYPSPDGTFAVEMTLAGRDATPADLAAVEDVVRSVSFTKEGTS